MEAGIFKKLVTIAALLLPTLAFSDQIASFKFRGLNNNNSSVVIDPADAQDLLNVDTPPGGQSIKKRPGYGTYKALGTGQAMHGGYHAYDSSGNDFQIWGTSTSLYGIVSDGTPAQLISSATLNSTWDCTDSQGSAYCVNSNRNAFVKTNGATMTWYASPLGTMIEATPDRVVVAGVSGSVNTLYFSQSNTFTNFVVGLNSTDPFQEIIASPGSKLTHIRWGCGRLLWWKDQSFGTMDFDDQFNVQIKTVSDTIGTFDNTSAIDPGGGIWFRGQDGHTYKYDCSFITKESIDITPNVQASGKRIANAWAQTTAADFNGGSAYASYTDTTTTSGSVQLYTSRDAFANLNSWVYTNTICSGTFVLGGIGIYPTGTNPACIETASTTTLSGFVTAFSIRATFQFKASSSDDVQIMWIAGPFSGHGGAGYGMEITGDGLNHIVVKGGHVLATTAFVLTDVSSTTAVTQIGSPHTASLLKSSTGFFSIYLDDIFRAGWQDAQFNSGMNGFLLWNGCPAGGCSSSVGVQFSEISISTPSGTYYSAVHNAPSITSWDTFAAGDQGNYGKIVYFVRAATNSFTTLSSTPAWVAQTNDSLVATSTGTYFQMKSSFTVTVATEPPKINDFTFNWFEGNASDQAYMFYFDNAIWESVAFGAGQSANNYIFKRDLINDGWLLYGFGANGMLVQNNSLYFGSPSSASIFKFGIGTSDNGAAINSYWQSKDFAGPDPFLQTQLTNIDIFARKDQGSTLTSTYTTDTSTATAYSISLSTSASIIQSRKLLPSGKNGYTFNLRLGDTSASSAWEILGYRITFNSQPYRPSTP